MIVYNKKNARYVSNHTRDIYTDLGYNYTGKVLKNTLSPVIFSNKNNTAILAKVENMIDFLIESVKQIRLQFMISLDKNDRNVN
jgi:hypothetical protein